MARVGVGKESDRLGFGAVGKQSCNFRLDRALLEPVGESLGALVALTNRRCARDTDCRRARGLHAGTLRKR